MKSDGTALDVFQIEVIIVGYISTAKLKWIVHPKMKQSWDHLLTIVMFWTFYMTCLTKQSILCRFVWKFISTSANKVIWMFLKFVFATLYLTMRLYISCSCDLHCFSHFFLYLFSQFYFPFWKWVSVGLGWHEGD